MFDSCSNWAGMGPLRTFWAKFLNHDRKMRWSNCSNSNKDKENARNFDPSQVHKPLQLKQFARYRTRNVQSIDFPDSSTPIRVRGTKPAAKCREMANSQVGNVADIAGAIAGYSGISGLRCPRSILSARINCQIQATPQLPVLYDLFQSSHYSSKKPKKWVINCKAETLSPILMLHSECGTVDMWHKKRERDRQTDLH